jgi:hypothetical protein
VLRDEHESAVHAALGEEFVGVPRLVSGSRAATSGCRWQRPSYFAYRVSDFDNVLGRLATDAAGRWWFTDGPDRSTNIR